MLLTFSKGIQSIKGLETFLGSPVKYVSFPYIRYPCDGVIGWGYKSTATKAIRYAKRFSLPYLALEDGFIRSVGLGVNHHPSQSLVIDRSGIYYDATRPSDLERLIIKACYTPAQLQRAEHVINSLKSERLSKYNQAPTEYLPTGLSTQAERVLVVDQTYGDASVALGCASEQSFENMLYQAVADNPHAQVIVKVHPDVMCGKKRGYLSELAVKLGCVLLAEEVNPWVMFDLVDKVYVVTSQLGFEALMAGKQVYCFGMPFYAGWGLTYDTQTLSRRNSKRTLAEVVYAAYIEYSRYIDLQSLALCQIEDTIASICAERGSIRG